MVPDHWRVLWEARERGQPPSRVLVFFYDGRSRGYPSHEEFDGAVLGVDAERYRPRRLELGGVGGIPTFLIDWTGRRRVRQLLALACEIAERTAPVAIVTMPEADVVPFEDVVWPRRPAEWDWALDQSYMARLCRYYGMAA